MLQVQTVVLKHEKESGKKTKPASHKNCKYECVPISFHNVFKFAFPVLIFFPEEGTVNLFFLNRDNL